jgi:hypothetical protein
MTDDRMQNDAPFESRTRPGEDGAGKDAEMKER